MAGIVKDSYIRHVNSNSSRSDRPNKRARRGWAFRLATITVSLLPFVFAEIALRVSGDPPRKDFAWVELHQLKPLFELDESSQLWVIPESRSNYFRPASFPATKPERTRRVFVLGGSTVQGRPWATETAFSTWLRFRLSAADPSRDYEVVNCGGVSYASYRVDKILDEVLTHQPDAIVVYTGHNEFLEERTYAEARSAHAGNRFADRLAENIRLVGWLSEKVRGDAKQHQTSFGATKMKPEVDARLDHIDGMDAFRRDPAWREGVHQHFEDTFRKMIGKCVTARVPLIVCEPASDLVNTPPFKTEPELTPATEDLNELQAMLADDPAAAGVQYRLGRLLYEKGDAVGALTHLTSARDEDVCPLRATTSIIDSVRRVCKEQNVALVPTVTKLDQRNWQSERRPDRIPDPELFVDHLHPTIAGHQRIATAIALEFDRLGWGDQDDVATARYDESVKEHLSGLGENYFARGKQRLEGLRRWAAGRAGRLGIDEQNDKQ